MGASRCGGGLAGGAAVALAEKKDYTQIEWLTQGDGPGWLSSVLFFVAVIGQSGAALVAIPCVGLAWSQRAARMALLGRKALQTSSRVSR